MVGSRDDIDWLREIVPGKDPAIDIVAVHGLNPRSKISHAANTWTVDNKFWLKDFLPLRIPNARILLFSYNSKVTIGSNLMGIEDHARNLLLRLDGKRSDDPNRPLLFVAHSLGGIVVKRALVEARLNPMYEAIRQSTYGLAFFGTPHHGGNYGDVVEIAVKVVCTVLRSPKGPMIRDLKKNSEALNTLFNDFRHQLENYKMLSFYETKPVNVRGINHVIVGKRSAQFGLPGTREKVIGLNLDHNEISKFSSRESSDYELVENPLCEMAKDAIRLKSSRSMLPPLISSASSPEREYHTKDDLSRGQSPLWLSEPIFLVPNPNVRNFVGREDILKTLEELLFMRSGEMQPRAALYGLGGVGKTQIAKRLASRVHKHYPEVSVFWIDASNSEPFHQSIVRLTRALKISGASQTGADVMSLFKDWISDGKCGKWFMIIDQLDDTKTLRESVRKDARTKMHLEHFKDADLIPDHPDGAILITTRDMKVAVQTECGVLTPVGPLEKKEAIELVQLTLAQGNRSKEHDQAALDSLVETLDCFPGPIDQAAKYISENMIDLTEYLQKFQNKDDAFLGYRRYSNVSEGNNPARTASNMTWLMSFKELKETNPDSVDLLCLMAYLDRNNIPEAILRQHKQELDTPKFAEACGRLKSFSLLEEIKVENEKVFTVPRMVQDHVQSWLQCHNDPRKWINDAVAALVEVLPSPDGENWSSIDGYSQHVKAVLGYFPDLLPESMQLATLLHRFSCYHRICGSLASAETYGTQALRMRQNLLGDNDLETISSTTNISRILLEQNRLPEAEALQEPVAEMCLKTLGLKSRETIDAVRQLAAIRGLQERYTEAEQLELEIVEASKTHFGIGVDSLRAMRDLAVTYSFQERHNEAEELQREVYESFKEVSGDSHPETLIIMSDLAKTFAFQRRFKEAEDLFRQITDRSRKVLGREHPHTHSAFRNLESMLKFQGLKKDSADMKRKKSLYPHISSRRKRPQKTPLVSTGRSMSDTITTYRKGSIIYQGTFVEDSESTEVNSLQSDPSNGMEKLSDKVVELGREFGRDVVMRWKNMRSTTTVTMVEEPQESCDTEPKPQFNTNIFETHGRKADVEQRIKGPTENDDIFRTPSGGTDAEWQIKVLMADTSKKTFIRELSVDTSASSTTKEDEGFTEKASTDVAHPWSNGEDNAEPDGLSESDSEGDQSSFAPDSRSKLEKHFERFKKEEGAQLWNLGVGIYGRTKVLLKKKKVEEFNGVEQDAGI